MIIEEAVKQFKEGKIQNSLDVDGYKEILGMWIDKSESSSFWSNVFEDLKERGVEDILYMCSEMV